MFLLAISVVTIDHYAEDGELGEVGILCSFYHEPLRTSIKTMLTSLLFQAIRL